MVFSKISGFGLYVCSYAGASGGAEVREAEPVIESFPDQIPL